ncbi:MAG TPA: polysaccharide pyruvyl transferase family protein [Chloroflexia bacterium]|nr:polysaccharide pyruvyl transferase family protein [Chloroflexia bacterium]
MKLFYHKDPIGNFGDDLNTWLWPRLIPDLLDDDDSTLFVGIGTILDNRVPDGPSKIIFGTGVGYGRFPALDERWRICCVRGPLTAKALGLPAEMAVTDPAVLVRTVAPGMRTAGHPVSFMPHHRTKIRAIEQGLDLQSISHDAGAHYVDPAADVEDVLRAIAGSGVVVAEAMHGAIVADALRVPWVPVQLYDHIHNLKWRDWCSSVELEYDPLVYSVLAGEQTHQALTHFLRRAMSSSQRTLSQPTILDPRIELLQERLEALKKGHAERCCIIGSPNLLPDPEMLQGITWLYEMQSAIRDLAEIIPVGHSFILVDQNEWGTGAILAGRQAIPFTERDGCYWGPPSDDTAAIRELERLREHGASFIVFAVPAFWWLDFYSGLLHHLHTRYRRVPAGGQMVVFELA